MNNGPSPCVMVGSMVGLQRMSMLGCNIAISFFHLHSDALRYSSKFDLIIKKGLLKIRSSTDGEMMLDWPWIGGDCS